MKSSNNAFAVAGGNVRVAEIEKPTKRGKTEEEIAVKASNGIL